MSNVSHLEALFSDHAAGNTLCLICRHAQQLAQLREVDVVVKARCSRQVVLYHCFLKHCGTVARHCLLVLLQALRK